VVGHGGGALKTQIRQFGRKFGLAPLAWRDYVEENKEEKGPHASL